MNIDYCQTFINLMELTKIFKECYNCTLSFMLDKDKIQLEIYSIETCNRWYMFVEYQFDIDDVINKFKDSIVREALNCEEI